ncbi:hypothetical protein GCM10023205_80960 [Yinghuangia aomiensis]|uniref:Uncharacterized protein n=1 Tax=Yinghuangia aomiensis TaxID=676205 RepID=A0ABP9IED8_9ACTN
MSNVWDVARPAEPEPSGPAAADAGPESAPGPGAEPAVEEVAPLEVEPPVPTGEPEVDRAVARLTQAGVLPTDRHAEVYEDVHRELREVLTGLDR